MNYRGIRTMGWRDLQFPRLKKRLSEIGNGFRKKGCAWEILVAGLWLLALSHEVEMRWY